MQILRDDRGVPHVIASNEHDLFFAQGYAEGSDRLFQMDTLRRYILGELAEVYGSRALPADQTERAIPVRAMVETQWQRLPARSREILGAFSDGVNAAMEREPLPVEFRILNYRPAPWTPRDSLAVAMVTVLDLIDDWDAIARRDRAYRRGGLALLDARYPFTDPCYDAPVLAGLARIAPGPRCRRGVADIERHLADARPPIGSNEWAVGANRALHRRALLANDPHLALQMPGVWYLLDLRAPGFHAAGATLPGCPAIVLGHNERIAWGATDGTVTSLSAFLPPARLDPAGWHTERFSVRFRREATKRYYRTAREFGTPTADGRWVLVHWNAYEDPVTPAQTFIDLNRAQSIEAATAVLARFPGPDAELRAGRHERTRRVSARRADPRRSGARALAASPQRSRAQLSGDTVRAAAARGALARRRGLDRQQQDVSRHLSAAAEPAVRAALPRVSHRTAAARAPHVRRAVLHGDADGRALAVRARARARRRAAVARRRCGAGRRPRGLERRDGRRFDDGHGRRGPARGS